MNKITVNMTKEALFDFLLFHAYSKLGGFLVNVLGLAVAFLGIFLYVSGNTTGLGAACYLGASFLFLAYTPILLKIRAKKQVQANPEYSQPVEVTFSEESGIVAKWQEGKREYPWEDIERAVVTPKTIGIYYGKEQALIIPKPDFGEQFADIFQMIARASARRRKHAGTQADDTTGTGGKRESAGGGAQQENGVLRSDNPQ